MRGRHLCTSRFDHITVRSYYHFITTNTQHKMNTGQDQQDAVFFEGQETMVQADVIIESNESVKSLEHKIKALHRSMSNARKQDDKNILTVITPQPGAKKLRRTVSSYSMPSSADSSGSSSKQSSHRRNSEGLPSSHVLSDSRQWNYFSTTTSAKENKCTSSQFIKREMQLAMAADNTRSLLQRQQMVHML